MKKNNIKYKNGDEYTGQIKNNKKHGYGIYSLHDGSQYKGQFINNKANGKGTYIFYNQDKYTVELKNETSI